MEKDKPESWLELFLYDMGTMRNAFAVFTAQRRVDGRKIDLTPLAYGTANVSFFVHGRHYIEIVSAAENAPPVMTTLAEELVRLASELVSRLAPGGSLILSGILGEREQYVKEGFAPFPLHLVAALSDGEWRCLHYRRL